MGSSRWQMMSLALLGARCACACVESGPKGALVIFDLPPPPLTAPAALGAVAAGRRPFFRVEKSTANAQFRWLCGSQITVPHTHSPLYHIIFIPWHQRRRQHVEATFEATADGHLLELLHEPLVAVSNACTAVP